MRDRVVPRVIAACAALAVLVACSVQQTHAADASRSCTELLAKGEQGVSYRILFAKNGAVQRYVLVQNDQHSVENANDMKLALEKQYGDEGVNAPPLRIISFKQGDGGMMIPDKAVDSCGRSLSFQ